MNFSGNDIKGAILDMDGVLWRANQPICDLPILFGNFAEQEIKVTFATNNGTHTVAEYVTKLANFGVKIDDWQIVTSSMATAYMVKKEFPSGGPIYIMGSPALVSFLENEGFFHSKENPHAVVGGLNWDVNYQMLKDTSLMIQEGLPFYFTNLDPSYPTPEGIVPGAGAILAALETATGIKARLAGKPEPYLFDVAMQRMGITPRETLVIGDRLSTDILGGHNAGCRTVFVLTGVNTMDDLHNWQPQPDHIIGDIRQLFD